MSKLTADDLINRFDDAHHDIPSEECVFTNLNFSLRNVLYYMMEDYQEDGVGKHLAARMLAFQIHQLEAISFDEWKC